jgi:hypothetical protein
VQRELQQIYMPLLEEAVECWRPIEAERVGPDSYLVIGTVPPDEVWAFQPGEVVLCRKQVLEDGHQGFVAYTSVPRDA